MQVPSSTGRGSISMTGSVSGSLGSSINSNNTVNKKRYLNTSCVLLFHLPTSSLLCILNKNEMYSIIIWTEIIFLHRPDVLYCTNCIKNCLRLLTKYLWLICFRTVRTLYLCEAENDSELSFEPNVIIKNGTSIYIYFKVLSNHH